MIFFKKLKLLVSGKIKSLHYAWKNIIYICNLPSNKEDRGNFSSTSTHLELFCRYILSGKRKIPRCSIYIVEYSLKLALCIDLVQMVPFPYCLYWGTCRLFVENNLHSYLHFFHGWRFLCAAKLEIFCYTVPETRWK